MHKICIKCGIAYIDTTKRKVGKTCSKTCASILMTERRKTNGSYKRTKEQNDKMVVSITKLREEGKWVISEEAKQRLSTKLKKAWNTGQMKNAGLHMKTAEHKERNSKLHTGRKASVETRKKMSLNSQKQTHRFSRCRGGYREDIGIYVRSSWEANYARLLNYLSIKWEYEVQTFDLGEGYTYTPDFKLQDGSFVELKGWLTEKGKDKLTRFKSVYPHVILKLITRSDYRKLYLEHSNNIPNWEKVST